MIDPLDYPYSIYKSSDGDALLDAHNDIIAVFDPHTEPEIERMVAAAPEMANELGQIVRRFLVEFADGTLKPTKELLAIIGKAETLLFRIEGDDSE